MGLSVMFEARRASRPMQTRRNSTQAGEAKREDISAVPGCRRASGAITLQELPELRQFLLHLGRLGDGLDELRAKALLEALSQAMDAGLDRVPGFARLQGDGGVALRIRVAIQAWLEQVKGPPAAAAGVFAFQGVQRSRHDFPGPTQFKQRLRRVTRTAKAGVNGIAVGAAEAFERGGSDLGLRGVALAQDAPASGGKFRAENLALRLVHGGKKIKMSKVKTALKIYNRSV